MYKVTKVNQLDGLTTMLIENRKSLLIGTGIAVAAVATYLIVKKSKKSNKSVSVPSVPAQTSPAVNTVNSGIGSIAI